MADDNTTPTRTRQIAVGAGLATMFIVSAVLVALARNTDGFVGGFLTGMALAIAGGCGFLLCALIVRRDQRTHAVTWLPSREPHP